MHKLISLVLLALVAHVARSAEDASIQAAKSVASNVCTGPNGSYQPGERYCLDETTSRVCGGRGEWFEHKCTEPNSKCQDIGDRKVQCLVHNHVDYPTGPPPGFDTAGLVPVGNAQRRKRNDEPKDTAGQAPVQAAPPKSDTCTGGPPGIDQPGDRYCLDETTSRVCNWGGEWVEFKCEENSKCQTLKTDPKKVQCFRDDRKGYPTGPPTGFQDDAAPAAAPGKGQRRRRNVGSSQKQPKSDAAAPQNDQAPVAPAKSDTCTGGPPGIDQPGDRYCLDETTSRVCNWGGEWVEFKCEENSKCQTLKTDPKKVQCFRDDRKGYPTGPPPGFQADAAPQAAPAAAGNGQRRRRNVGSSQKQPKSDAAAPQNDQAPVAPAKSDTCTGGPPGIDQPGDRYCVDETTSRVCNWGGEWVEFKCEENSKCQTLKTDPKKVQCFRDDRKGYPTGPPPGFQADAAPQAAPAAGQQ
jgi:hypothetical protein